MLVKLDENLCRSHVALLLEAGHQADRVHDQGLSGEADPVIWGRVFLSSVQWVRDRLFIRLFIRDRLGTGTIVFGTRQWLHNVLCRQWSPAIIPILYGPSMRSY